MPIKQTTYICDVCGEKFTLKKQFEAHQCERPETLYLARLQDFPDDTYPTVRVWKGRIASRKGKLSFQYDEGGFMPISLRPGEDFHDRVMLADYAGIKSEFTDDDVRRCGCAMFFGDPKDLAGVVEKLYGFMHDACVRYVEGKKDRIEQSVKLEGMIGGQLKKVQSFVSEHIGDIVRLADEWNEPFQSTDAENWNILPYRTKKGETHELYLNHGGEAVPENEPVEECNDDDWFIMRLNINWADEIDFECAEVITGKDRRELEERAAKADTCHLSFGSNEYGEEDDIMSCITFNKITQEEHDVLERVGMLSVGNITYNSVWEGLTGEELDEEDNDEDK